MVNWTVTDTHTYQATLNGLELSIAPAAYSTWTWLLSRDGRAVTGGNCRELDGAKEAAVRAAEKYATSSATRNPVP